MCEESTEKIVKEDCRNIRQGDVIDVKEIVQDSGNGQVEMRKTPYGVAVISQTCDIVQKSKKRVCVAPIIDVDDKDILAAKKGRRPLYLYLHDQYDEDKELVADLEYMTSIPKQSIVGQKIIARAVQHSSGKAAAMFADRLGRVFTRFPYPDEIPPVFKKFQKHIRSKSDKKSDIAIVLSYVADIRIGAQQWENPPYDLTVIFIVKSEFICQSEDANDWASRVIGLNGQESIGTLSVPRICALLVENISKKEEVPDTVISNLWAAFCDCIYTDWIKPELGSGVSDVEIVTIADTEFSYRDYIESMSLDLSVLSNSNE